MPDGLLAASPTRLSDRQAARDERYPPPEEPEQQPNAEDPRSPARHDRDRVLYSAAFSRLAGVTQVVTPVPTAFPTHNRLTHSLKVAQVARSIADKLLGDEAARAALVRLGGLDVDAVEAAALAHDLGHPPFGHAGEQALDDYARDELGLREGFEGNAQTYRVVTRLEPRRRPTGLTLTAATRAAILKYPWRRADKRQSHRQDLEADRDYRLRWSKFGCYSSEWEALQQARAFLPDGYPAEAQTVEAAIMDVADDITYALHDLEDFYLAGILVPARRSLPVARLADKLGDDYPVQFHRATFDRAAEAVGGHLESSFPANSSDVVEMRTKVQVFIKRHLTTFLCQIEVNDQVEAQAPPVRLAPESWHQVQLLKELTRSSVINRADMSAVQRGQQRLLVRLLEAIQGWREDPRDRGRLPTVLAYHLGEAGTEDEARRCIVDYVAGLSDHQAFELDRLLHGGVDSIVPRFAL